MLTYPEIDPVAVSLGPLKIHWYGLMYLIGFAGGWWLAKLRARRPGSGWNPDEIGDLVFYIALGVVLGGRIGYVIFYNFPVFADNPLIIFKIWQGGMSFHGGLIGVLIAFWLYAKKTKRGFFDVADLIAPVVPIGLGAGRLGNFINGELWGRVTDVPWGMVFPGGGPEPRHPSQLYQFLIEGPIFFTLIWLYSKKPRPTMAVSGFFLIFYGIYRFLTEFVREPDTQLGFVALNWMTQGQLLSVPMIVFGVLFIWMAYRRKSASEAN